MESINILHDDHTYVYGNMMAKKVDGNFVEPYYYYGAPEIDDSDDCITHYYPSINRFIVLSKRCSNKNCKYLHFVVR